MYYSVLRLPNGTELKGGEAGSTLKALTLHTAVNAGQEFTIGSAFSDYIEAEIWADPGGSLQITAGDAMTYATLSWLASVLILSPSSPISSLKFPFQRLEKSR